MRWHASLLAVSLVVSTPAFAGFKKGGQAFLTGAQVKKILSLPSVKTTFEDKESGRTFSCVPTLDAEDFSRLYFGGRAIDDGEIFNLSSDASGTTYFYKVKLGGPIFLGSHRNFIDGSYDKIVFMLHEERRSAAAEETKAAGAERKDLLEAGFPEASLKGVALPGAGAGAPEQP
jgi:hypothetical protein